MEVYYNGSYGRVCDDVWGFEEAQVVCRQLGFYSGGTYIHALQATHVSVRDCYCLAYYYAAAEAVLCCAQFGRSYWLPISMDDVACSGSESRLTDCSHITNHNCDNFEDAAVRCVPGELNS